MHHVTYPIIRFTVLLGLCTTALQLCAQEPLEDRLINSDPKQLLEISHDAGKAVLVTSIADFENRDVREAPANVTVITKRQLAAAGARNLYEALLLIPGISIGRDVDDVFGIGIHGNWAEEGKCLFMVDGRQLNENDFGTYAIGDRIPLANVDRIEVSMGPGSVLHGGYAALGVINIITRNADNGTGTRANIQTGFSGNDLTRTMATVSGSHRLSRDQEVGYMTSHVRGRRSNALRLLPDSTLLNFADSTTTQTSTFQFNYRWRNFKATMLYMEESFAVSDASYSVQLRDIVFGLEYRTKLSAKTDLYWKVNHADQLPWYYINTGDNDRLTSNTNNQRTSSTLTFSYKPTKWLTTRLGVSGYHQNSVYYKRDESAIFSMNGKRSIGMNDGALFGELAVHGKPGSLSGGYRLQYNSLSGQYFAPRVAYTKVLGVAHFKALWSKSFKIPTIMNLNYGPEDGQITAEYVTTMEAEVGMRIGKSASMTANVFDTRIDNPIVYMIGDESLDSYVNRNKAGTYGLDVRLNWETKRTTIMASYGMNIAHSYTDLPEVQLPDSLGPRVQGLPGQRAVLVIAWDASPSWTIRTRLDYRSTVYSYQRTIQNDVNLSVFRWPVEIPINLGFTWRPRASNRLAIDASCRNLTDVERTVSGPYKNGTTPFALSGREFTLGITYKFVQ